MLYIPHGSDESGKEVVVTGTGPVLYIPHGSDESEEEAVAKTKEIFFISHMVQMKDITRTGCSLCP